MDKPHPLMDALYSLYHREVSAVEAYDRGLKKFVGQPEQGALERLRADHVDAVRRLGALIRRHGGVEPDPRGSWRDAFAAVVEGLASVVNDEAPLRVLHRLEVAECEDYARLLADPLLAPDVVSELQKMLDTSQNHQVALEAALENVPVRPNRPMI